MNNLFKAIDELIKEKFLNSNDIEVLNLGEIYCKEKNSYLDKEYFIQYEIKSRTDALKILSDYDLCILIQHTDLRSRITIPYKIYDYINSSKKIFVS